MTKTKFRILLLVILFLCNAATFAKETWFNQRVTWKYGKEGLARRTTINPLFRFQRWPAEKKRKASQSQIRVRSSIPNAARCRWAPRQFDRASRNWENNSRPRLQSRYSQRNRST